MMVADKRKGLFAQVALIISSLTGVGFSSGHEIWSFFVRHGYGGMISIIIMPFVLAAFIYMTLSIFSNEKAQDKYREKCRKSKLLNIATNIIELIVTLFIGIVVISMISAAGDVVRQLTGIHLYIGCVLSAAVVFLAVAGGSIRYVTRYLSIALPVILASTIVICLVFLSGSKGEMIIPKRGFDVTDNWLTSLMLYISYNMLVVRGVASSLSDKTAKRKRPLLISLIATAAFGSIAVIQFFVESKTENIAMINGFQMVYAAQEISPVLATTYRVLILVSAIGTAIACFYAFISKFIRIKYIRNIKQKKLVVLVSVLCCIGSLMGFANIISVVYPLLGAVGLISLVTIIYRYYIMKDMEMNKIVICMDSFKGSLSSSDACRAVFEGLRDSGVRSMVTQIPVSDGGEGFVDAFLANLGGNRIEIEVSGPYGDPVIAGYALIEDGETAVIEMAAASGLCLSERREPLAASSYGTGELIADALDRGVKRILLGLGGSATNDGGAGMLSALGVRFTGKGDRIRRPDARDLFEIVSADASDMHPGLINCEFLVCCDVRNKLLGPEGASMVFGPQKGASEEDVVFLDNALGRYRDILIGLTGRDIDSFEGSGAAGGVAAGLYAFCDISIRPGSDVLLEMIGFDEIVKGTKVVITGEGRIDSQTAGGKLPVGIAGAVRRICGFNVPVIALVGEMRSGYDAVYEAGITAVFSTLHRAAAFNEIRNNAFTDLKDTAHNVARLLYNTKIVK